MKKLIQISLLVLCVLLVLVEAACFALGLRFTGEAHLYDRAFAPVLMGASGIAFVFTCGGGYATWRWYRSTSSVKP